MKVANIVGTRPQYIKLAPVLKAQVNSKLIDAVTADTGQHYDASMSDVFYDTFGFHTDNLETLRDKHHLTQFGDMVGKIGQWLTREKPDYVLVFGDTNSTLAAALCAAKLQIPLGHVEAGIRTGGNIGPQEEINRILTDRLSEHLFVTDEICEQNLIGEKFGEKHIFNVGDVMQDAFHFFFPDVQPLNIGQAGKPKILMTLHRSENTDDPKILAEIVNAITSLADTFDIFFPAHPRSKSALEKFGLMETLDSKITLMAPLGYLDLLAAYKSVDLVISDSGGVPKEAAYAGTPSIVLRSHPIWVEMGATGVIQCCDPSEKEFTDRLRDLASKLSGQKFAQWPYDRNASLDIVRTIEEFTA